MLQAAYRQAFVDNGLDALVLPTTPLPARQIGQDETVELNGRPVPTFFTYIRHTDPGAGAGIPGLSLPAGLTRDGLPVGLELDGRRGAIGRCRRSAWPSKRSSDPSRPPRRSYRKPSRKSTISRATSSGCCSCGAWPASATIAARPRGAVSAIRRAART